MALRRSSGNDAWKCKGQGLARELGCWMLQASETGRGGEGRDGRIVKHLLLVIFLVVDRDLP